LYRHATHRRPADKASYLELDIASILKEFLEVKRVPKRIVSGLKWLREAATICTFNTSSPSSVWRKQARIREAAQAIKR
jgi:hypothetical protein